MRAFASVVIIGCLAALDASGALARTPMHKTSVTPRGSAQVSCLDSTKLLSHVAYTVADGQAGDKLRSCSQLLSTDTLLTVRRWGQT